MNENNFQDRSKYIDFSDDALVEALAKAWARSKETMLNTESTRAREILKEFERRFDEFDPEADYVQLHRFEDDYAEELREEERRERQIYRYELGEE